MKKGKVYLICDPSQDLYKIGVTTSKSEKRIKQLQTGNGCVLHFVHIFESDYPFKIEKMLHTKYDEYRMSGEWFSLPSETVINFIDECVRFENILHSLTENPFFK